MQLPAILMLIAVFKLGDLTRYISESVVIGFMASAALLLAIGQLANAIGVRDKGDGHMQVLQRAWLTLFHGDAVNYRALVLSVSAVVLAILRKQGWPGGDSLDRQEPRAVPESP